MILFVWLRRGFDLICAIAGLALLVFLGPWMLLSSVGGRVPEAHELVRVDGITAGCRRLLGGVNIVLEGYGPEFRAQLDSCADVQVELTHSTHVSLNVSREDLRTARLHSSIRSFGFEVDGRVVQTIDSDLRTARLDRAVVIATGISGSLVLLWLGWVIGARRGNLVRLLVG